MLNRTSYKKGHKVTDETKHKISTRLMNNKNGIGHIVSQENKERLRQAHLGKPLLQEIKDKIVETMKRKGIKPALHYVAYGKDNHFYKGGVSKINKTARQLAMGTYEYKLWRKSCMERDNFTDQKTGISGGELVVHHINNFSNFPELRTSLENGITLSKESHQDFHKKYGIKNNTREQLLEFLNGRIY